MNERKATHSRSHGPVSVLISKCIRQARFLHNQGRERSLTQRISCESWFRVTVERISLPYLFRTKGNILTASHKEGKR